MEVDFPRLPGDGWKKTLVVVVSFVPSPLIFSAQTFSKQKGYIKVKKIIFPLRAQRKCTIERFLSKKGYNKGANGTCCTLMAENERQLKSLCGKPLNLDGICCISAASSC